MSREEVMNTPEGSKDLPIMSAAMDGSMKWTTAYNHVKYKLHRLEYMRRIMVLKKQIWELQKEALNANIEACNKSLQRLQIVYQLEKQQLYNYTAERKRMIDILVSKPFPLDDPTFPLMQKIKPKNDDIQYCKQIINYTRELIEKTDKKGEYLNFTFKPNNLLQNADCARAVRATTGT